MAKIEKITYRCDVCSAEFEYEKNVTKTTIPCYGGERNEYITECKVDLCRNCSFKLRKAISDNFAIINDWYGVHITPSKTDI